MKYKPTSRPLTVKEFQEQKVGLCAGCGCACGYLLYEKEGKVVDLYGHPADPRGMGSFCTKGLVYIQQTYHNPMRLRGVFVKRGEEFSSVDYAQALRLVKERISRGKTAFLLGRQAGLEEYLLARASSEEVFTDALVVDFLPSTVEPTRWKDFRFILAVDAEPVFSEVMSMRWLVDAVESGAYLFCLSSRYETLCAKAKDRLLLRPDQIILFLESLLSSREENQKVDFVKKSLSLLRGSLVLVGAHLLSSPFRDALLKVLSELRRKFGINYSFVGDVMPFPAKPLKELFERLEEFDNLFVVGNLLRYFRDEHIRALRDKYVISFQVFPNFTAHHSDLVFALELFYERDFINYRHGFGYLTYSPAVLSSEEVYSPYRILREVLKQDADLEGFLSSYGVDYRRLKEEGIAPLSMKDISLLNLQDAGVPSGDLFVYTDSTLVDDIGHWNPWTHEMERLQRAYVNPFTAKRLGLKEKIQVGGVSFDLVVTENLAEGVVLIPSEYEEFQPFDPGYRVGAFLKNPCDRYEVLL